MEKNIQFKNAGARSEDKVPGNLAFKSTDNGKVEIKAPFKLILGAKKDDRESESPGKQGGEVKKSGKINLKVINKRKVVEITRPVVDPKNTISAMGDLDGDTTPGAKRTKKENE